VKTVTDPELNVVCDSVQGLSLPERHQAMLNSGPTIISISNEIAVSTKDFDTESLK
jgi:hypothetical protein